MKMEKLTDMTIDALVERFAEISLSQDEALLYDEIGRFNRLFDKKVSVMDELRTRPGDQRSALLRLFSHPNAQVRLNAAKATLAVAPKRALRMLEEIADSKEYPQAGDAGMSLWNLDRGVFKPT